LLELEKEREQLKDFLITMEDEICLERKSNIKAKYDQDEMIKQLSEKIEKLNLNLTSALENNKLLTQRVQTLEQEVPKRLCLLECSDISLNESLECSEKELNNLSRELRSLGAELSKELNRKITSIVDKHSEQYLDMEYRLANTQNIILTENISLKNNIIQKDIDLERYKNSLIRSNVSFPFIPSSATNRCHPPPPKKSFIDHLLAL
jgi:prefoldin subunit 5